MFPNTSHVAYVHPQRNIISSIGAVLVFIALVDVCGCANGGERDARDERVFLPDDVARNCARNECGASARLYTLLDALPHILLRTCTHLPLLPPQTCPPSVDCPITTVFKYCHPGSKLIVNLDFDRNEEQSHNCIIYHVHWEFGQ